MKINQGLVVIDDEHLVSEKHIVDFKNKSLVLLREYVCENCCGAHCVRIVRGLVDGIFQPDYLSRFCPDCGARIFWELKPEEENHG